MHTATHTPWGPPLSANEFIFLNVSQFISGVKENRISRQGSEGLVKRRQGPSHVRVTVRSGDTLQLRACVSGVPHYAPQGPGSFSLGPTACVFLLLVSLETHKIFGSSHTEHVRKSLICGGSIL